MGRRELSAADIYCKFAAQLDKDGFRLYRAAQHVPVVPISAAKNQGVDELVRHAVHIAKYQERPGRQDFCGENEFGGAVHRCIHAVCHIIEDHAQNAGIPIRFAATKLIEGDELILEKMQLDENEKETLEHLILQMEKERGLDRSAAIADMRFNFIERICESTVVTFHIFTVRTKECVTN